MVQHYITGQYVTTKSNGAKLFDTSLEGLSVIYGVSWESIADATFGGHGASAIYGWLSTHGGLKQTADSSVPTGYHWSFAPGMVAEIPGVSESKSPIPGGVATKPAGPAVDVGTTQSNYVPDTSGGEPPLAPVVQAGIGGIPFMGLLVIGAVVYFVTKSKKAGKGKGKGKGKKGKKGKKGGFLDFGW